jgi:hypothetical protein
MASYGSHLAQANKNLQFLQSISPIENYEWQVTVCFYVAVHLVNAHLAIKANLHYRTHSQVEQAINPFNNLSPYKLNDTDFLAYSKLHNLSRRARYLIHDNMDNRDATECLTYSKHLAKSLKNLDSLLSFFEKNYAYTFNQTTVKCIDLKSNFTSKYFKIV